MNNIYSDFPAMMQDGRAYSNWQPTSVINEKILHREKITTNWDYREYLQKNADSIIAYDISMACKETGCPYTYTRMPKVHVQSDLKNDYLTRVQLQERMYPYLTTNFKMD